MKKYKRTNERQRVNDMHLKGLKMKEERVERKLGWKRRESTGSNMVEDRIRRTGVTAKKEQMAEEK